MDMFTLLTGEQVITYAQKTFSELTEHEFQIFLQAIDNEVHKCNEYCSEFICFKYEGQTCAIEECCNLFLKTRSNMKYCSICRNAENIIIHQHGYRDIKDWDCYCVRFLPDLFYENILNLLKTLMGQ